MEKGFFKLKNAAKYLDMSENTFRKYVMPYVKFKKVGNNIYFSVKELHEFMEDRETNDEKIKAIALDLVRKTL